MPVEKLIIRLLLHSPSDLFNTTPNVASILKNKGYLGKVGFDEEAGLFHGEVVDLHDVITFQGKSVDEPEQAFRDSIDDYMEFCLQRNEKPVKPFSGRLMLRLPTEVHRKVYGRAKKEDKSLNEYITEKLSPFNLSAVC